jgi:hypothetical protein
MHDFGHGPTVTSTKSLREAVDEPIMMTLPDTELLEAFCDKPAAILQHYRTDPPPPEPPSPRD